MPHRSRTAGVVTAAALVVLATALTGCSASGSTGVAAGCKPKDTFSTITKGTLTVTLSALPPFITSQGTSLGGIDGDILNAFAKEECVTVTATPVATAAVIPAVQTGRSDVAAGSWWRSASRAKIVGLTEPVYLDQMALVSKEGYDTVPALKGKTVGTVDGDLWVGEAKAYFGDDLKIYKSTTDMYQDLKAGRLQVAMDSFGSGSFNAPNLKVKVAKPDPVIGASLQPPQTTFPISFDNPALLKALDGFIATIKANGQLAKILQSHGLPGSAANTGAPRLIS
ncbi:substrate-binding periplasmic protein [Leifsonia shinshuensis]|uniref:Polar amino acid transport system substrate-binding protein n=1 Tax=Leifsonia shinshuensis TaxID=150026 RepID=A0A853CR88_9MICO|nr:transporter substrate-binding domain-containing protein [Leifsonia shinshuensis]NYJ22829.1 polar amino acid transport system substrate-binding protein [Leifsonia shinshuensis]